MKKLFWLTIVWQIIASIFIIVILWRLWNNQIVKNSLIQHNFISAPDNSVLYKNDKMGFSFRLPKDLFVTERYNFAGIFSVNLEISQKTNVPQVLQDSGISIVVYEDKMTMDDLAKLARIDEEVIVSSENIVIDNHPAIKYDIGGISSSTKILLLYDNYGVEMVVNNLFDPTTFKFSK
jgi:hypothetical protein